MMTGAPAYTQAIERAAQWLAEQQEPPARVVQTLRERFGLTMKEACEACAKAQHFRSKRRALP